ncbi:MAG: NAD(P)-binding protein [Gammaproteobacteria bacterium]|nr:NAD(P)-binding protein [Gammaproteobacteria bacterium]
MSEHPTTLPPELDVLVVGAGFSGLYLLHRLRKIGLTARAVEAGSGVGGTWYWNRYPGARCDVESMQYSYSVFEGLEQDWEWSELFSAQPEILRYANHVANRYGLRRDIQLDTRVTATRFDETAGRWTVTTQAGEVTSARFVVMATGCLSTARTPDFTGMDDYRGNTYHTGHWPHEPVDFSGQRVAIIGTGSSAIQALPVIAGQAAHVTVFQRTPNYSIPSRNGPMPADYAADWKNHYAKRRQQARHSRNGLVVKGNDASAMAVSPEQRQTAYEEYWHLGGTQFMAAFNDLIFDAEANESAAEFVRNQIRTTVNDPTVAELLAPKDYPIGTKRICVDSHYFETFNRDNVALVDIRHRPIEGLTTEGLVADGTDYAFDAIVFATGFDAMTGTLAAIDIRGRAHQALVDKWEAGPRTYLGLTSHGFPNLFMITGPGSPSVLSNMMVSIEQHVDWVTDLLAHMKHHGLDTVDATLPAEDDWVEHVNVVAHKTLYPRAASWYMGANIPGKPRLFLPYIGGVGAYRERCDAAAASGYEGFEFETKNSQTQSAA